MVTMRAKMETALAPSRAEHPGAVGIPRHRPQHLPLHDDQIPRRRPELVGVGNLQRAAERRSVAIVDLHVVEALARNDLVPLRRIRYGDLVHRTRVDLLEQRHIEVARRHERAADPLDQQVRTALADDHAFLDQLILGADHVVRAARLFLRRGELLVEVIETRLQRRDRRRLLLDRALELRDLLRVRLEALRVGRERILQHSILGQQLLLAVLELRDLLRGLARPGDQRIDAMEHLLALTDLCLERALLVLRRMAFRQTLHARDRAVDLADEGIRVTQHLRHGVALCGELVQQLTLLDDERLRAVGARTLGVRRAARDDSTERKKAEREQGMAHTRTRREGGLRANDEWVGARGSWLAWTRLHRDARSPSFGTELSRTVGRTCVE